MTSRSYSHSQAIRDYGAKLKTALVSNNVECDDIVAFLEKNFVEWDWNGKYGYECLHLPLLNTGSPECHSTGLYVLTYYGIAI